MRTVCTLTVTWWAALTLLSTCGCGSDTEASSDKKAGPAAAINGGQSSESSGAIGQQPDDPLGPKIPSRDADPLHPEVVIETSMGEITVRLDAEKADFTVDNFLSHAEKGHYDGTIFHQVFENYVILGGGWGADFSERPVSTAIYNQADNGLKNRSATIAMARDPQIIDSATCQFFINVKDNPQLDHQTPNSADTYGYCVFGKVTGGMEVVDAISRVPVHDTELFERTPVEPVTIRSVKRVR